MMKINNYAEWKQAVQRQYEPFREVSSLYLNESGKKILRAFGTLTRFTEFCDTAEEFLNLIDSLDECRRTELLNGDAAAPISALRKIREIS